LVPVRSMSSRSTSRRFYTEKETSCDSPLTCSVRWTFGAGVHFSAGSRSSLALCPRANRRSGDRLRAVVPVPARSVHRAHIARVTGRIGGRTRGP
jgi:hypothetical protein